MHISAEVSIRAYLYVSLKNKIYNHYHKSLTHIKYTEHVQRFSTELDHSTGAEIETRELEKQLNDEIEKLPQQCQIVFKLSRGEFLSNKEIASRLNISVNTVEQHMRRALRQLRAVLGQRLPLLIALLFYRP